MLGVYELNWYKQSEISSIKDRTELNERIRKFEDFVTKLEYMSKLVYQNAPDVKKTLEEIRDHKMISSFPSIKKILVEGLKKVLDNYKATSECCKEASDALYKEIKKLKKERDDFTNNKYPKIIKERVQNAKKE